MVDSTQTTHTRSGNAAVPESGQVSAAAAVARPAAQSNAPDTFTGAKVSPEGYTYVFGLRGGRKEAGEDPGKLYVITGADQKPLAMIEYDGKHFSTADEIGAYKAKLAGQGYALSHLEEDVGDRPGEGYPIMPPQDVNTALAEFDKLPADSPDRFRNITEAQWYALKNRGWRHAALLAAGANEPAAAGAQSGGASGAPTQPSASTPGTP